MMDIILHFVLSKGLVPVIRLMHLRGLYTSGMIDDRPFYLNVCFELEKNRRRKEMDLW